MESISPSLHVSCALGLLLKSLRRPVASYTSGNRYVITSMTSRISERGQSLVKQPRSIRTMHIVYEAYAFLVSQSVEMIRYTKTMQDAFATGSYVSPSMSRLSLIPPIVPQVRRLPRLSRHTNAADQAVDSWTNRASHRPRSWEQAVGHVAYLATEDAPSDPDSIVEMLPAVERGNPYGDAIVSMCDCCCDSRSLISP